MKNLITCLVIALLVAGCKKDFFTKLPPATASLEKFRDEQGIDYLLVGAYAVLDGAGATELNPGWPSAHLEYDANFLAGAAGTNDVLGDIRGGDANAGTEPSDAGRVPYVTAERFDFNSQTAVSAMLWKARFDGVSRANDVLKVVNDALPEVPQEFKEIRGAEARFLRAHYYFDLKRNFNNVPWYDETTVTFNVPNTEDIWPKIEADFQYAIDHLPVSQPEVGRATKGAAQAYLGKVYMYQHKYSEALPLLTAVVESSRYGLNEDNFRKAFDMDNKNSKESIFAIQHTVNDGTRDGSNGNILELLNGPHYNAWGTAGSCCGFYQPTYDLVAAFQTDANGLPLLDTYQNTDVKNDYYPVPVPSSEPFTMDAGNLDPRLDWTVGRRGVPWLDWGINPGLNWIRSAAHGGPYQTVKRVFTKEQRDEKDGSITSGTSWWAPNPNAINYDIIRYADVLLLAAEAEIEVGTLSKARGYVNQIRTRAKNSPRADITGATHYVISTYDTEWTDKELARKAVRFERRLELALEGHRFYDLVRWGIAAETLNPYFAREKVKRPEPLGPAQFTPDKHEYLPIPQGDINLTGALQQNPGY